MIRRAATEGGRGEERRGVVSTVRMLARLGAQNLDGDGGRSGSAWPGAW